MLIFLLHVNFQKFNKKIYIMKIKMNISKILYNED